MIFFLTAAATMGWLLALAALHSNGQLLREKINAAMLAEAWQKRSDFNLSELCKANDFIQTLARDNARIELRYMKAAQDFIACRNNLTHTSLN